MKSLLTFVAHPMVALSLLLHGLLLAMPLPPAPEPIPEEEPEQEEVQISSLKSLTRPAPKPTPTPVATPTPLQPKPPVQKPVVARPPVPPPVPTPTPIAPSPMPTPTVAATPTPVATPAVEASPSPEADQELQDFLGQFQSSIGGVGADETAGLGIPYYLFQQPELFFTLDSLAAADSNGTEPVRVDGIDDILWASRKRPDAVYQELQILFEGFSFTEAGEYGGGTLYQVTKGSTVRFINLIQSTDRTATFVVIWNRDPNVPAATATMPVPAAAQ